MAPPGTSKRRGRRGRRASRSAGLPLDALFEIMLRLPAREVCRLRAVCRSWRAVASDRVFIDAHASCHPGPYVATCFSEDDGGGGGDESCGVDIIDLSSGDIVKSIYTDVTGSRVQRTRLDLVCLVEGPSPLDVTVLNPVTGATYSPTKSISEDYEHLLNSGRLTMESCAFGKVPSTGEYKALRLLGSGNPWQLCDCEIMTVNGAGTLQWRALQGPPLPVCSSNKMRSVVINGVVYFLLDYSRLFCTNDGMLIRPGNIVPFNLETEEWMGTLNGPKPVAKGRDMIVISSTLEIMEQLSLADLNGSLVMVHAVYGSPMDLWFLSDLEQGLWVKRYSIDFQYYRNNAYPLLLLDDEKIVFLLRGTNVLQSYDLKDDTYTDILELEDFRSVGIYTGNLLSLEGGRPFCLLYSPKMLLLSLAEAT
uniref:F-box domain-containing protein n=1 Tax=Oryza punctata TaxID=4537 RepID=A0A0E0LI69_ORYPU